MTVKPGIGFERDDLLKHLNEAKIGTRLLFGGNMTKQPYFKNYSINYRVSSDLRNTDDIMHRAFWLGVYPGLTKEMMDYVIGSIGEFIKKYE